MCPIYRAIYTPFIYPPLHSPYIQAPEIRPIISPLKIRLLFPWKYTPLYFSKADAHLVFSPSTKSHIPKIPEEITWKIPASYPERKARAIKIGILSFPFPGPVYFFGIFLFKFPVLFPGFIPTTLFFLASHSHAPCTTADSPSRWILPFSESVGLTEAYQ